MKATKVDLPDFCFGKLPSTGEAIVIDRGESGYRALRGDFDADVENEKLGVTKAQAEAMFAGSMFGWNVPGANPDNYDSEGNWIKEAS